VVILREKIEVGREKNLQEQSNRAIRSAIYAAYGQAARLLDAREPGSGLHRLIHKKKLRNNPGKKGEGFTGPRGKIFMLDTKPQLSF